MFYLFKAGKEHGSCDNAQYLVLFIQSHFDSSCEFQIPAIFPFLILDS